MRLLMLLAVSLALAGPWAPVQAGPQRPQLLAKTENKNRTITITIENLKYKPEEIEIAPGDTVIWVNKDDRDHMVKAEDGSFESPRMGSGKTYKHTFDKAGKFRYGDDLSPRMHGTVTVKAK